MKGMHMAASDLTAEQVREALNYDPETGLFTWLKPSKLSRNLPGGHAGRPRGEGYVLIGMGGTTFPAHRIAWMWMTGRHPNTHIDHINGIRYDNRWSNLREVTASENAQNSAPRKKSHSGLRGVYPASGKWIARICLHKTRIYLGIFDTPEEAHAAYLARRRTLFPKQPIPREYLDLDLPPPPPPFVIGERETPVIQVGQRWRSGSGRTLRIFEVVEVAEFRVRMRSEHSGVRSWASLSRFNERATGYKLIAKPAGELEFDSWIETLRSPVSAPHPKEK